MVSFMEFEREEVTVGWGRLHERERPLARDAKESTLVHSWQCGLLLACISKLFQLLPITHSQSYAHISRNSFRQPLTSQCQLS